MPIVEQTFQRANTHNIQVICFHDFSLTKLIQLVAYLFAYSTAQRSKYTARVSKIKGGNT
jgi:hypothetical protein